MHLIPPRATRQILIGGRGVKEGTTVSSAVVHHATHYSHSVLHVPQDTASHVQPVSSIELHSTVQSTLWIRALAFWGSESGSMSVCII